MKLNIIPISQRDERWKLKRLGNSTLTIGSYGCLLTCHSMSLIYFGHELTPELLNEVYKSKGVFDEALINFYAAGTVFEDFNAVEYYDCQTIPCDLNKIDVGLSKKQPIIAMVDFDLNPNTKGDWHFVLIIGKTDDGHYLINDPWTGETYYFDAKYGDPSKNIYGLRIYEGIPKTNETNEDTLNDLQDKLSSCNSMLSEKALESNSLRDELLVQEKDNEDLASQLSTARSERDKATWELKVLQLKNEELGKQIKSKDKEIKSLEEKITLLKSESIEALGKWELLALTFRKFFVKEVTE
jgi:hypothetical protein